MSLFGQPRDTLSRARFGRVGARTRRLAGWAAAAFLAFPAVASGAPDTPDPGFGTGGDVITGFPGRTAQATGMLLDRAGRPVVVAKTGQAELGILRLDPDGGTDPGFASGTRSLLADDAQLTELVEHGDGYVAGGWIETTPGARRFALVRWEANGAPGFSVSDALQPGEIGGLAVDGAQRIVAAGRSGDRIAVARYGADGTRDGGFSRVHDLLEVTGEEASGVVVEPSGRVLVAGTAVVPGGERRFLLLALTAAGTIDTAFGSAGAVTFDVGDGVAAVRAITRQPDGKLLVAGTTDAAGAGVVARYLPTGAPDPTFSTDGIVRIGATSTTVDAVALQPDGKVVAAGTTGGDSFIARLRPGGARDPGFGADGVVRRSLGPAGPDGLTGVGVAASGRIVGGGRAGGAVVLTALTGGDTSEPGLAMTAEGLGDLVTFTISATNRGADPARDVRVDISPPAGLAASAITTTAPGTCAGASCALGTVPAGATARVTLLARARRPGPLPTSARVTTSTFDADPSNNAASVTGVATRNRVAHPDRTKPVVKLRLPVKRLRRVHRLLRLRVTLSERASVRFTARAPKRVKRLVRSRRVALDRKGRHRVALRLTSAGRKAVKQAGRKRKGGKRRRLVVVVAARATDRAGNHATKTLRKTLRR
jgi:uncharacterized delta-60 repeat protein/uncharacterized repeat protein (TIGR01451 family)